jgi:hypothetical protein
VTLTGSQYKFDNGKATEEYVSRFTFDGSGNVDWSIGALGDGSSKFVVNRDGTAEIIGDTVDVQFRVDLSPTCVSGKVDTARTETYRFVPPTERLVLRTGAEPLRRT